MISKITHPMHASIKFGVKNNTAGLPNKFPDDFRENKPEVLYKEFNTKLEEKHGVPVTQKAAKLVSIDSNFRKPLSLPVTSALEAIDYLNPI